MLKQRYFFFSGQLRKKMMIRFFAFTLLCICFSACKKENNCEQIHQALYEKNREETGAFINGFLHRLKSKDHNRTNLEFLVGLINGSSCDITAKYGCYNCIYTSPGESEIVLSFNYSGALVIRTIDLSNRADNTMIYVNVHE